MIGIVIVEDQVLLRDSLEQLIDGEEDMRVLGVGSDAAEAPALCERYSPQLILLDVVTGGVSNGLAAAATIRQKLPDVKIVLMTALPEITFVGAAQKAGAHSFVYKNVDRDHLLYVLRCTMKGQGIYPGPSGEHSFSAKFSDKEIAVIRLVCQGKSRSEIALALSLSEGSVKAIITGILNKTGFDSIMRFAVYAVANGFILPKTS